MEVKDGKIDQALEVSLSFTDSVDEDFIDGTKAMAEAKKKGLDDSPGHAPRHGKSWCVLEYRQ